MGSVHYFQRYHKRENVVTNNTLLLLSRLYHHNPLRLQACLDGLLEEGPRLDVGVDFRQQERKGKGGVPDGVLCQASFRLAIETKLHENKNVRQLLSHLDAFGAEETKVLLSLAPHRSTLEVVEAVERGVAEYNRSNRGTVQFAQVTFEEVISAFRSVLSDQDFEMLELLEDYAAFCEQEGLLPTDRYTMRVLTAGSTFDDNVEHGIYYDLASRGYRRHAYLGLYRWKGVRAVGKLVNVVVADVEDGELRVLSSESPVTSEQGRAILGVVNSTRIRLGWTQAEHGHRFFVVDRFFETVFLKVSKYPIQRAKYFDLRELIGDKLPTTEKIAEALGSKEWK